MSQTKLYKWPYRAHSQDEKMALNLMMLLLKFNILKDYELLAYHSRDFIEITFK